MTGNETKERSAIDLFWGTLFICWGVAWGLLLFGVLDIPVDLIGTAFRWLSPLFWIVLGVIILTHDDGKIEQVKR